MSPPAWLPKNMRQLGSSVPIGKLKERQRRPSIWCFCGRLARAKPELDSARLERKRDIKQFRQACKELGFTDEERYAARDALHGEKESGKSKAHMSYGDLLSWLRQWRQSNGN